MMDEGTLKEIERRRVEESRLYENYIKYYEKRDFVKAGEFLWGCINNLAYALGLVYGKKLSSHREVVRFLEQLVKVNGKEEFARNIDSARAIHANFYHGFMDENMFERRVKEVEELRRWLIELLEKSLSLQKLA